MKLRLPGLGLCCALMAGVEVPPLPPFPLPEKPKDLIEICALEPSTINRFDAAALTGSGSANDRLRGFILLALSTPDPRETQALLSHAYLERPTDTELQQFLSDLVLHRNWQTLYRFGREARASNLCTPRQLTWYQIRSIRNLINEGQFRLAIAQFDQLVTANSELGEFAVYLRQLKTTVETSDKRSQARRYYEDQAPGRTTDVKERATIVLSMQPEPPLAIRCRLETLNFMYSDSKISDLQLVADDYRKLPQTVLHQAVGHAMQALITLATTVDLEVAATSLREAEQFVARDESNDDLGIATQVRRCIIMQAGILKAVGVGNLESILALDTPALRDRPWVADLPGPTGKHLPPIEYINRLPKGVIDQASPRGSYLALLAEDETWWGQLKPDHLNLQQLTKATIIQRSWIDAQELRCRRCDFPYEPQTTQLIAEIDQHLTAGVPRQLRKAWAETKIMVIWRAFEAIENADLKQQRRVTLNRLIDDYLSMFGDDALIKSRRPIP